MKIELLKIQLENFKGLKSQTIEPNGQDAFIFGGNNTGKTTIADAFYWLLFNKDSKGRTDFKMKTLDANGQEIHNLRHSVYAVLRIDGKETHIKKTYFEHWPKKKGSATASFEGHKTEYEIGTAADAMTPKKKTEFTKFISSIVDESIFKLVTNPFAFHAMKQEDRKNILMSLVSDVTDQQVIDKDKSLAKLKQLLGDGTIEELKARVNRDKKATNDKLKEISPRIDEINHNMPDITKIDVGMTKAIVEDINSSIDKHQREIQKIKNGSTAAMLEVQKEQLKQKLADMQSDSFNGNDEKLKQKQTEIDSIASVQKMLERERKILENRKKSLEETKAILGQEYKLLKAEFDELQAEQLTFSAEETCSCCGQIVPEEIRSKIADEKRQEYNLQKSSKLQSIKNEIDRLIFNAREIKAQIEDTEQQLNDNGKEYQMKSEALEAAEVEAHQLSSSEADVTQSEDYKRIEAELEAVAGQIKNADATDQKKIQTIIKEDVEPLQERLMKAEQQLNDVAIHEKAMKRIAELEKMQQQLGQHFEELEEQIFLTEKFTRTKVDLIEDSINSLFSMTKFKLFEVLINEGVKDVCVATFDGVPFDAGLNTAAQVNVGLDIINALSKHYDFYAPIMIDNAESVTDILKTESQQLKMVVSKEHKSLEMKTQGEK